MFLLFAICTPAGLLAQTNTLSGSLINAPGNSSQTIPSRPVVLEFYNSAPTTTQTSNTNTSNDYSFTYSGGPIFLHDNARVYVDLSSASNPFINSTCVKTNDITLLDQYLQGLITLTNIQKVAADVNLDGTIDLTDRNMLGDAVVGSIDDFDNSITVAGSTYSDRNIVYPTVTEVASLGTTISYTSSYDFGIFNIPTGNNSGYDFYSIRLGDINGDCASYASINGDGQDSSISQKRNNEFSSMSAYQIGPNPFISSISIKPGEHDLKRVSIMDINGRELLSKDAFGLDYVLLEDNLISNLQTGTYLLRLLEVDGSIITRKIVKK